MSNAKEIARLESERALLVAAVVAVKEFHAARTQWDEARFKHDAAKLVTAKRETWLAKLAQVEPIIRGGLK